MKSQKSIIQELNKVLATELVIINQTFLHARMLKNWGFEALGKQEYHVSIQAMKNADKVIERILFLEGLPNLQNLGALQIGQNVPEILNADTKLLAVLHKNILDAITHFESQLDFQSREILSELLKETEEKIDFYDTQNELLIKLGTENYLQLAVAELEAK